MEAIKINKTTIDKIPFREKGQAFYRDTHLTGFGLYVGAKSKTYYCEKRISGKTVRVTIGKHGQITPEIARKKAHSILGKMTSGVNPIDEKRGKHARGVSLFEVWKDFKETRGYLKEKTLYDYQRILETAFPDWQRKALSAISKDMVFRRHKKLGDERGGAYANLAMRFLRSVFNFAQARYEDSNGKTLITENPVVRLSQMRAWFKVKRRQTLIRYQELPDWFDAVEKLTNNSLRDYLLFVLLTGLRRQEAARLTWEEVNLKTKTLTVAETKNSEPLTLPLSGYLFDLLKERQGKVINQYVFPGSGPLGYIIEPRRAIMEVRKVSKVKFTVHDLRRTFITIAEGLDIPHYALKRLVNHKMTGDVTAGYIVADVERLRKPMQLITDKILTEAGRMRTAKIIKLRKEQ